MYSLHDITSVCPKLEPVSDEGEYNEDEDVNNHSDAQMDRMSDEIPLNNNAVQIKVSVCRTLENHEIGFHVGTTARSVGSHDNISISQESNMPSDQTAVTNSIAGHTAVSVGMTEGQIMKGYTTAPLYENGDHEDLYYPVGTTGTVLDGRTVNQGIYTYNVESRMIPQQYGAPEGLPAYQSSIYGTMPYVPMASKGEFSPYQGLSVYSGSHRSLTPYEMGIPLKPCCNCPCHLPASSPVPEPAPAPEMKSQRPSVIMVPAKNDAFLNSNSKVDSTTHRLMAENSKLRSDLHQNGINEMVDSDSSDDDEDGKREKYFRVNIDGATARFKLTNEDWERIPINTFPSGGRLLSGDWTRIFLNKVKESNPWCSLRFKNNHVRSENSRKIHSAVFFRGGAECKRPECNVKVRFVIRKERGKHVDVTYVGNVCHSRQPGGSYATHVHDKKRRQTRRGAFFPA